MAEPLRLREPRRPRVSLMMSLPSQTETHWMIMLQIGQISLSLAFSFCIPPSLPPSITLLLFFPSILLLSISLHSTIHPSSSLLSLYIHLPTPRLYQNSTHLKQWQHAERRIWSNLMMLPFQQWHLINRNLILGMSREEVVFFMSCSIIE